MKHSTIIQRLGLFLLLMASAMGAWAESSVLFNSTEQGRNNTVTTLTKSPVTITFDNCKTSGAGNIYELVKGTGLTISVTSGYRIREIVLEDTEGGNDYDNGGLDRIGAYSDTSYSMAFVKNSGSQPDNNNIQFRNYDAPAQSFRIVGHNMSKKGQLKIRRITVVYVREGNIRFSISSQTLHVGEERRYAYGAITISTSGFANSELTHSVGNSEIASCERINGGTTYALKGLKTGETTLNVKGGPNADVSSAYASIPLYVVRNDLSPSLAWTEKTMKAWEVLKFPTLENMPDDYQPGYDECTYISSDESVVKPNPGNGTLVFGGSGYGKTATISVIIPQNDKYNADTLQYTVTVDNEMRIASVDDWKELASQVSGGNKSINATMTNDIDLGATVAMVGTDVNYYTGTFDGAGHTISMDWNVAADHHGLFYGVENATIKNVCSKGKITTSGTWIGALVHRAKGNTTISKCVTDVDIVTTGSKGPYASGLVQYVFSNSTLTVNDCMVLGSISGGRSSYSAFVFDNYGTAVLNNCLLAMEGGGSSNHTFGFGVNLNNCYYLNSLGYKQGTQVTTDQLKSGEVAYLLQNGRTDNVWGQTIGTDTVPQLTADATRHVNKVTFTKDEQPVAARYANTGKAINGSLPTVQDILGDSYDAHHYYTLAFADDFNALTAVTADKTVAAILTDKEYYEIASKEDWKAFFDLVNSGQNALNGKLTNDIDLGSNVWMIGDYNTPYSGTFDGDGHTLSIDWNVSNIEAAPFKYTSGGATIRNLHTKGQITTDDDGTSGLIVRVVGKTTISGCISEVDITSSYANGACGASGLVSINAYKKGDLTITDCIVKGTFNGTTENACRGMSGFIYNQNAVCTISNSLYLGTNNGGAWSSTFADNATLTNCYYLNPCGTAQGTQVTEKQLKNGYVTKLLQADRTDQCYWAQQLGEMPSLYDESKENNTNYVYWRPNDQQWYCRWLLIEGYMPIGIDFHTDVVAIPDKREADKPYTIALPCDWTDKRDRQIYVLTAVDKQANIVRFSEVKNNSSEPLKAYHPYLVISKSPEDGISHREVNIKAEPDAPVTIAENGVNWCATYEGLTNAEAAAAGAYILQSDGQFHKVTTDNTSAVIPPYRAYITLPENTPSQARAMSISFGDDGTTTGLHAIETTDADGTVRYYDMQGRYIGTSLDGQPRGIYVKDGKKIMKK